MEMEKQPQGAGYIVCGHVAASYIDDQYQVYVGLSEAGVEWKVCSCSLGENACHHYGCLLEALKRLRQDATGRGVQVKKRRAAAPLERLKKRPLAEIIDNKMIARLAERIPVASEPLSRPFEQLFCVCRKPNDIASMLQCEDCDEWCVWACMS